MRGHQEIGITITRSRPRRSEPGDVKGDGVGLAFQSIPRTASPIAITIVDAYTSQIANFSSHARTTANGPPNASAKTTPPKIGTKIAAVLSSRLPVGNTAAGTPPLGGSKAAPPTSGKMVRNVAARTPRRPQSGRKPAV